MPNETESSWLLNLCPGAAEASGCLLFPPRPWNGRYAIEPDEERSASEAIRRARGNMRRFCAANRLNRLGTLTYAEACSEPRRLRDDLAAFFRRLRDHIGEPFPYLWVPEWHPGGHGLHAHFAVGRFVHYRAIRRAWGQGFVHIKLLGDLPVGAGTLGEARLAAWYLAKYIGKDLGAGEGGLHRYDVAQGFGPQRNRLRGASLDEVVDQASALMGAEPSYLWDSASDPAWGRPHSVWARWS